MLSTNAWWMRGDCLQVDSCLSKLLKHNLPTIARGLKDLRPCGTALDHSLNSSYPNEEREEISSVNADSEEPDVEEVERIRSVLEETNKCYFCEYKAPVPWIHPSKGDNLSGMDIWDHVWSEHPQESEWFA